MRARGARFDFSKPFVFVQSRKEFDQLEGIQDIFSNTNNTKPPVDDGQTKKLEIIVPKIEEVKKTTEKKQFAKISPNYIRLPSHLNIPKESDYELTEVDHLFLKTYQKNFIHNNKSILTPQFLVKAIIYLQLKAGKDCSNIPRNKRWLLGFISLEYPELVSHEKMQEFTQIIYNFWKNKRQEVRFPLLRSLWKPNVDQYNHMLAFKPRQKLTRNLRRTNRVVEEEIILELETQFGLANKLCQRILKREELKHQSNICFFYNFVNQCKQFGTDVGLLKELCGQTKRANKEKIESFSKQIIEQRTNRTTPTTDSVAPIIQSLFDKKQSIVSFLATVVNQAQNLDINYEKVYDTNQPSDLKDDKIISCGEPSTGSNTSQFVEEDVLWHSLKRTDNMLIRVLEEQKQTESHNPVFENLLDLKRGSVSCYYFGDDDDGDFRDLKKNVSTSFKKFMQMSSNQMK